MKVRMIRHVTGYVQVQDLEPGRIYDITDDRAEQFIANGMAEPIADETADLEAAALRGPRRRG